MSIFSTILQKLGIGKATPEPASTSQATPPVQEVTPPFEPASMSESTPPAQVTSQPTSTSYYTPPAPATPSNPTPTQMPDHVFGDPHAALTSDAPRVAPTPAPIKMVDVMSKLDKLALANPQKLAWKVSIVDLLKLLDIESSYAARKDLAIELGCPAENMNDSARMNIWLHKTVLQKIAENGGNIPKELLD